MRKKVNNSKKIFLKITFIMLIIISISFFYIDNKIKPIAIEYCINEVEFAALDAINKTIYKDMTENADLYKNIATLSSTNEVSAVTTDTYKINAIKANIMLATEQTFNEIVIDEVQIPIGVIYNNMYLFGKGWSVPVKMIPMSTVNVDFASTFEGVGINQSLHKIIMECSVDLKVMTPYDTVDFVVTHSIAISETLILGDVPNSYTYIDDTTSQILEKFTDYAN
ncbi:MAG: sporulation protein YunB [Clostridia bacterium]